MKRIIAFVLAAAAILAAVAWVRYGGGDPYADLSTPPIVPEEALEVVLEYPEPVGNVAAGPDGRLFFTVHPESRPRGNRLLEFVDGASVPFPDVRSQLDLFDTVLGLAVDTQNRLWTIDHGNHGLRDARILAFDLERNAVIRDQVLPDDIAPAGSYLQDLRVTKDGRTVIIADASFWRQSPALIVYDVESGSARRVLEGHESVSAENYVIRANGRELRYLGGIVTLKGGVDGLAVGPDWIYFGAINGSGLYRVAIADVRNEALSDGELAARVERYSPKPLSDGMSLDEDGNVYVTDVEHNSVYIVGVDRKPRTLLRSPRIRWPDALSIGPAGRIYVADSALPELVLQSREHVAAQSPYRIFRFPTGDATTADD